MPNSIDPKKRIVMLRTVLTARRAIGRAAEQLDISVEEYMVAMAVRLGHLEGRLMDISDVAATTGQKFSSCHRHLKHLKEIGLVRSTTRGKRVLHEITELGHHRAITEAYHEMHKAIRHAGHELEKLDR